MASASNAILPGNLLLLLLALKQNNNVNNRNNSWGGGRVSKQTTFIAKVARDIFSIVEGDSEANLEALTAECFRPEGSEVPFGYLENPSLSLIREIRTHSPHEKEGTPPESCKNLR